MFRIFLLIINLEISFAAENLAGQLISLIRIYRMYY